MTNCLPGHLHIVHVGDHQELANAIASIVKYQQGIQPIISPAHDAAELAARLTDPAAVVMFTGHGAPDGRIGTQSDCYLHVEEIAEKAGRPFNAHGLIMDACYGWDFRDAVSRQSSHSMAYLAACGMADYADTLVIVNLAISLVGNSGKPLPHSADDADYAFCRALGPARGRWRHSVLEPDRIQ